jgi:hypothetical protein
MAVTDSWIDQELAGCQFKDMRLGKRFRKLLEQLSDGTAESIPLACQDWANTKAAYRFLANERVKEDTILAGHFQSTRDRFAATDTDSPVLILHDTTEFTYSRTDVESIDILHKSFTGKMKRGRLQFVDIVQNFPTECRYVLEMLGRVYGFEAETRERGLRAKGDFSFISSTVVR